MNPHLNHRQRLKTFYVKTFGCQMNISDSERITAILQEQGLEASNYIERADLVILNGCSVREKAVHKAISLLGTLKDLKPKPIIAMAGCVGQMEKEKLFVSAPYLDFVFGTDTIDALPEMIYRARCGERHFVTAEFDSHRTYSTRTKLASSHVQAYVNIMKGCDKYCSFCVVPYVRGREKSRRMDDVLEDLSSLTGRGVREVMLLGQNVNSFGKGNLSQAAGTGEESFPQLLRAIERDPGLAQLKRVRFMSSHPLDFSDELLECFAPVEKGGVGKLAMHLHLPVQSGSNRILKLMNRRHTIEDYIEKTERLRELNPLISISTDLIVGFPTETDQDAQATRSLMDRLQFDGLFAFAYSPRPGTRAAELADDVPESEKNRRLNALLEHQLGISEKRNAVHVGRVHEILIEGEAKNQTLAKRLFAHERVWTGRTSCNRLVHFLKDSGEDLTGQFVNVKITGSSPLSLKGEVLK